MGVWVVGGGGVLVMRGGGIGRKVLGEGKGWKCEGAWWAFVVSGKDFWYFWGVFFVIRQVNLLVA